MTTLYDSTNPAAIPVTAQLAAGYIDGDYPSYQGIVARVPSAYVVSITVEGKPGARVCDCETGDLSPQQAITWAQLEIAFKRRPTIYCDWSTFTSTSWGLGSACDFWVAWVDSGRQSIPPGAVARQYAQNQPGATPGTLVDLSVTNGLWPIVAPIPLGVEVAKNFEVVSNPQTGAIEAVFAQDENNHLLQYSPPASPGAAWTFADLTTIANTVPLAP